MGKKREEPGQGGAVASLSEEREARRNVDHYFTLSLERFVIGLPYKKLAKPEYERKDGGVCLTLCSHDRPVPFGLDRLSTLWLAAAFEAGGMPADDTIHVASEDDIVEAFGLERDDEAGWALLTGFNRLSSAMLYVRDERPGTGRRAGSTRVRVSRFELLDGEGIRIAATGPDGDEDLVIPLSRDFAESLRTDGMPLSLKVAAALKYEIGALDLYVWQGLRSRILQRHRLESFSVPLFGAEGLLAQLGREVASEAAEVATIQAHQQRVAQAWPECPNRLSADGRHLVLYPWGPPPGSRPQLPGVRWRAPTLQLAAAKAPAEREQVRALAASAAS